MPNFSSIDRKFERKNLRNVSRSAKKVETIYLNASRKIGYELHRSKAALQAFTLPQQINLSNKLNRIIAGANAEVTREIKRASVVGWQLANQKNNILASQYLKNVQLATGEKANFFNTNVSAMNSFINRSEENFSISSRIWQTGELIKDEIKTYVGTGIAAGRSAAGMSRDVRHLLKDPDKLFRRVRNAEGKLVLSKAAKAFKPGPGKYRSSYKNAMRLTRTETNMAYRMSDMKRYNQMDFVLGYQVHLSASHPVEDICDYMQGKYPKKFVFGGWHPHCFCYVTSILASKQDFIKSLKGVKIPGKGPLGVPYGAEQYLRHNLTRFKGAKNTPYWLAQNEKVIEGTVRFTGKPLSQIRTDANVLLGQAERSADEVYSLSKEYADRFGGVTTDINYKGKDSMLRKAKTEHKGQIGKINDSARTTVVVEKDQVQSVYRAMAEDERFVKLKNQTADKYNGYTGVLGNIETSEGILCEIQVNSPEMIFAKSPPGEAKAIIGNKRWNEVRKATGQEGGLGHLFYEDYRVLHKVYEKAAREQLAKLSEEYYSHFR